MKALQFVLLGVQRRDRTHRGTFASLALVLLSGCATFRSYDQEMNQTLSLASSGQVDAAIQNLSSYNRGKDKELLYYCELGELERLKLNYASSRAAWMSADNRVQAWETAAKADPARVAGVAASYVISDKLRPYEGQDYEKVMLTTRMAMNFLTEGRLDQARVAIKQTHEREAVVAALRAKEYSEVEAESRQKGYKTTPKDLNGYPVQQIDNPAVNALRNSYQSALSHYLAGFIYEALGEASLAAAGYRTAIELRPGVPLLEEGLAGLDQRVGLPGTSMVDTLFVIETGFVPARYSQQFPLPIPVNERLILVPVAFPILQDQSPGFTPGTVQIDGRETLTPVLITSIDLMARRALKDEMPGIMVRSAIRATASAIAQYQLQVQASRQRQQGNSATGTLLDIGSFALGVGSAVVASIDEREWRSLPAQIFVARGKLPAGTRTVAVQTPYGPSHASVSVSGKYTFVALRFLQANLVAMVPKAPLSDRVEPPPTPMRSTSTPRASMRLASRAAPPRPVGAMGETGTSRKELLQ